ncbi:hypothetical protein BH23THE1_BH23THE1_12370 [soil metagenome]
MSNDLIECGCGCGQGIDNSVKYYKSKYIIGHNVKNKLRPERCGKNNPRWRGGRLITDKYIKIYAPNHPKSTKRGYVKEHRLIYEEYYNCCLLLWTDIHHIDGNTHNNKIENLMALIHGQHSIISNKIDMNNRICSICKSTKTYIDKKGIQNWHYYKNKLVCDSCKTRIKKKSKTLLNFGFRI